MGKGEEGGAWEGGGGRGGGRFSDAYFAALGQTTSKTPGVPIVRLCSVYVCTKHAPSITPTKSVDAAPSYS